MEEVAAELPLLAILELCGIPPEDRKDFFKWTNTMMFSEDPDMSVGEEEAQLASLQIIEYAMKLAAQHKDNPKDHIIGALLNGKEGDKAQLEELKQKKAKLEEKIREQAKRKESPVNSTPLF